MEPIESVFPTKRTRRLSLQSEATSVREMELVGLSKFKSTTSTQLSRAQLLWKRLKPIAIAVGAWSLLLRDIRKYGVSLKTDLLPLSDDQEIALQSSSKWVLRPDTFFARTWAFSTGLILIFTAFYLPIQVCFDSNEATASGIDYALEVWFVTDLILNFFTGYENHNGFIETSNRKIAKKYLKSWFFFDFVACFPSQFLDFSDSKNYNGLLRLMRLPRLYRLVRVLRIVKLMQGITGSEMLESAIRKVNLHGGVLRLLKFSFMVVIIVHVVGCFWYFLAWLYDFDPSTWVFRAQRQNDSSGTLYLVSIYWVFTVITTVGFGDITAANTTERIYSIIVMGFGIAFYSYTISNISSVLTSMNQRELEYKTTLAAINDFALETNLPKDLKESVLQQVMHNYTANMHSWYSKDKLLSELPAHLRTQIATYVHKTVVAEIPFFQLKDPGFISFVVPKLKSVAYTIGDIVYKVDDYASETFFLLKGEVILKDEDGIGFKTYLKGSYFGEIEVLKQCLRTHTCQVISLKAECLVLSKDSLEVVMTEFPSIAADFISYAQNRETRNDEARRYARMGLKVGTLRRINKKTGKNSGQTGTRSWSFLKQQYMAINLIDKRFRGRSGSFSSSISSPNRYGRRNSGVAEQEEEVKETTAITRTSTKRLTGEEGTPVSPVSPMRKKRNVVLPLPHIPSVAEDSIQSFTERVKFPPQVTNTLQLFEEKDYALHQSLRKTNELLSDLMRRQKALERKAREINEKLGQD